MDGTGSLPTAKVLSSKFKPVIAEAVPEITKSTSSRALEAEDRDDGATEDGDAADDAAAAGAGPAPTGDPARAGPAPAGGPADAAPAPSGELSKRLLQLRLGRRRGWWRWEWKRQEKYLKSYEK